MCVSLGRCEKTQCTCWNFGALHLFPPVFPDTYMFLTHNWQTFPVKGRKIDVLGFVGLKVSITSLSSAAV